MRVFVTGASGFIGSAVIPGLVAAGHQVVGLARSEAAVAAVSGNGAQVLRGSLDDLDVLQRGARESDGVIHLAFIHDFSRFEESVKADLRAIEALGSGLAGTNRPLVVASGVLGIKPGSVVTELDVSAPGPFLSPRFKSSEATLALAARGVRPSLVRLAPTVHGAGDHGFIHTLVQVARERGVSGFIGDGSQRWPAVHRLDAARLFRLAVEKAPSGVQLHGTAEEGVTIKAIAEVIGKKLQLPMKSIAPDDAGTHFGWIGRMIALDAPASNKRTRELLDWTPTHQSLLEDLEQGLYTE